MKGAASGLRSWDEGQRVRLKRVYVRFYKSFNFDYERKANTDAKPMPWEHTDAGWFPHVRVDLDPEVTAVVGANEAGKSHLLDAIRILLTGEGIERRDFCRYSTLYSVESGLMRSPEFGGWFEVETDQDRQFLEDHSVDSRDGRVWFFRPGDAPAYLLGTENGSPQELAGKPLAEFERLLPAWLALRTDVALPDSVAIAALSGQASVIADRGQRNRLLTLLLGRTWTTVDELSAQSPALLGALTEAAEAEEATRAENQLGRQLLLDVARIDGRAFADLADAMAAGREGQVNGIIQEMNNALARHLNLSRWWAQDDQFQLRVSPREHELVFTIRDRTGTDYSFSERSRGLRYFLSYYVQLRAHQHPAGRTEILAMDEPDAYLSSSGQQDLLRVLESFAHPEDGSRRDQVVYVTHSPFLINRNAGHRIRVLDKGRSEEGTRVVRDATKNHYEPLRSSLGAFVAETAFIGGANLFVEGLADQVLLAGLSPWVRSTGAPHSEVLDLNSVTIVPAGSASSVPYLAYLARGRDEVKPPCVALLDGDEQGDQAVAKLTRSEASGRTLLKPAYIVQLSGWAKNQDLLLAAGVTVRELEDLLPVAVAVAAARRYAVNLVRLSAEDAAALTDKDVHDRLPAQDGSLWDALATAFADRFDTAHIDKVGFAREVIALAPFDNLHAASSTAVLRNFGALFRTLADLLRDAASAEDEGRRSHRLRRIVDAFARDYPDAATRDRVATMLKEIEHALADTGEDDATRLAIARIRRDHRLADEPNAPVEDHNRLLQDVAALKYQRRLADQTAPATPPAAPETPTKASTRPSAGGKTRARPTDGRSATGGRSRKTAS